MAVRDDVTDYYVTWPEVHRDAKALVKLLMTLGEWKGIVAVTRGGLGILSLGYRTPIYRALGQIEPEIS